MNNLSFKKLLPFAAAGVLLVLAVLMMIPGVNQAIYSMFGVDVNGATTIAYNGFEPFVPFVPGYFPDDFDIAYVGTGGHSAPDADTYTETYASTTHFFQLIQSQGEAVPELIPNQDLEIQGQPARLDPANMTEIAFVETLDTAGIGLDDGWVLTMVLKDIYIQLVTNLPAEEALRVAEGLVPAICTSTPTPES